MDWADAAICVFIVLLGGAALAACEAIHECARKCRIKKRRAQRCERPQDAALAGCEALHELRRRCAIVKRRQRDKTI